MTLCQYKDILGQSGKGLHSYRINILGLSLASVDLLLTLLVAILLNWFNILNIFMQSHYNIAIIFIALWLLGIVLHLIFCVKTPITKYINLSGI